MNDLYSPLDAPPWSVSNTCSYVICLNTPSWSATNIRSTASSPTPLNCLLCPNFSLRYGFDFQSHGFSSIVEVCLIARIIVRARIRISFCLQPTDQGSKHPRTHLGTVAVSTRSGGDVWPPLPIHVVDQNQDFGVFFAWLDLDRRMDCVVFAPVLYARLVHTNMISQTTRIFPYKYLNGSECPM